MSKKTALTVIMVVAICGIIFSGYLTYYNLLGPGCHKAIISCGSNPVEILGLPQCVYGLAMYVIVAVLAGLAMRINSRKGLMTSIKVISLIGVLFAASLSYYELFVVETGVSGLPACVYGFFLYLVIFISAIIYKKEELIVNN